MSCEFVARNSVSMLRRLNGIVVLFATLMLQVRAPFPLEVALELNSMCRIMLYFCFKEECR